MPEAEYYDRIDDENTYTQIRFLAKRGLQSAELNDLQSILDQRIRGVANALFRDGNVLEGAETVINEAASTVTLLRGIIYVRGWALIVPEATLDLRKEDYVIGVYHKENIITAEDDAGLRDPAEGTKNYDEVGANRAEQILMWGDQDDTDYSDDEGYIFIPVHQVQNGVLVDTFAPPESFAVEQAIARYDRDSNGSYVVDGFQVAAIGPVPIERLTNGTFVDTSISGTLTIPDDWVPVTGNPSTAIGSLDGQDRLRVLGSSAAVQQVDISLVREIVYTMQAYMAASSSGTGTVTFTLIGQTGMLSGKVVWRRQFTAVPMVALVNGYAQNLTVPETGNYTLRIEVSAIESAGQGVLIERLELLDISPDTNYSIEAGTANIEGFKVQRTQDSFYTRDPDPEIGRVALETVEFDADSDGNMTVEANYLPVNFVEDQDTILRMQVAESVTRGSIAGTADDLPRSGAASIVTVRQGSTTFQPNTDYVFRNSQVDWSPGGSEPLPGSGYIVTYQFNGHGQVDSVTPIGFRVSPQIGASIVIGSEVIYSYDVKLHRYDRIGLSSNGLLVYTEGPSPQFANDSPEIPSVPEGVLSLALIYLTWWQEPEITNDSVFAVPYNQVERMRNAIDDLYYLVAQDRLETDIAVRDNTSKKGVFVDPFIDDSLRDEGISQSGAVSGGGFGLALIPTIQDFPGDQNESYRTFPHNTEVIVSQLFCTGSMLINPYQAFAPIPVNFFATPSVDNWIQLVTTWASEITRRLTQRSIGPTSIRRRAGFRQRIVSRTTRLEEWSDEVVGRSNRAQELMRERDVTLKGTGFDNGEEVDIFFDGKDIGTTPSPLIADGAGALLGVIRIPANTRTGTKEIRARGHSGHIGRTTYTGMSNIVTVTRQRVLNVAETTIRSIIAQRIPPPVMGVDPLAQTFTLTEGRYLIGIDVAFANVGDDSRVVVQIRTTSVGIPTDEVLAEASLDHNQISADDPFTRFTFPLLIWVERDQEYAFVVLTDNAEHSLKIAELGKLDVERDQYVVGQPYQVGVLLSSSNAATWTPHQRADLKFRIVAAKFYEEGSSNTEELVTDVDLATLTFANVTDILALIGVDIRGDSSRAEVRLQQGTRVERFVPNSPVQFPTEISGETQISMRLFGNSKVCPIILPFAQLITSILENSGTYVTPVITGDTGDRIEVIVEHFLPGSSTLVVEARTTTGVNEGDWNNLPILSSIALPEGGGWFETTYGILVANYIDGYTKIRLILSGNAGNRPTVRNLRCFVR